MLNAATDVANYQWVEHGTQVHTIPHDVIDPIEKFRKDIQLCYESSQVERNKSPYQPILYLQPQRALYREDRAHASHEPPIVQFEGLERLKEKETGRILRPDQFIHYIEKDPQLGKSQTVHLTRRAFMTVTRLKRSLPKGHQTPGVSINIAPSALPDFVVIAEQEMQHWGVNGGRLTVECTERQHVDGSDPAFSGPAKRLCRRGVHFALDDVGSPEGVYDVAEIANLSRDLPWMGEFKLDMQLLRHDFKKYQGEDVPDTYPGNREGVSLVDAMGCILEYGKIAVVEGVEDDEQAEFVRQLVRRDQLDPDHIRLQGFFHDGKPAGYSLTRAKLERALVAA